MNVLSNIPFVIVGLMGIVIVGHIIMEWENVIILLSYLTFFAGLFLTGFGSAWYHLKPTNETLVWDRLPMTIAFAGFFCSVVSELVNPIAGIILLIPLLLLGFFSVVYWIWTERRGRGDLRLYVLVQFLPMLLIPMIMVMYDAPEGYIPYIVALLIFYLIAKVFELFDSVIYSWRHFISGHTLKHLIAAVGAFCLLLLLQG
ncbi:MAG: hypothetical protein IME96_09480 [Proteobacteria bacterium]|nr:hypothetical protein [Pseudomonadota bacterium]